MKNEYKNIQNIKERIINRKKKRNNEKIGNINKFKEYIIIIKFIIILCSFTSKIKTNKFYLYGVSKITLKIKGIGYKYVLGVYNEDPSDSGSFQKEYYPNLININGNKQNNITYKYYFNQEDNFVELIWNNNINNCKNMFRDCSDIIEMDLSDFDTSEVTTMHWMFYRCSSLISLNLSNFNTFKVQSMWSMFSYCSSLTSLNLSNFDTSQVTEMCWMFQDCYNLEYINLKNFEENKLSDNKFMFDNVPVNIVVCMNENNKKILSELNHWKCYIIDCSDDWKLKQKKIINDNCIDNCNKDTKYKYEYNGKCVENCQNGDYFDDNNINKCKCELEKCLSCRIRKMFILSYCCSK